MANEYLTALSLPLKDRFSSITNQPTKPFSLHLAITYLCQSRCKICSIWKIYKKNSPQLKKELNYQNYEPLFKSLENDLFHLTVSGGEPFLKEDFTQIIETASKQLKKLVWLTIITNGISPNITLKKLKQVLPCIKERKLMLRISVDGNQHLHDKIRGIPGNYKNALLIFNEIKKLKTTFPNLRTGLSYTISNENVGMFKHSYKDISKDFAIDISEIGINLQHQGLLYHKKSRLEIRKPDTRNKLDQDIQFIQKAYKKIPFSLSGTKKTLFQKFYTAKLPTFSKNPKSMIIPCTATRSSYFIDPYGDIYPCVIWNNKLGNIKNSNLKSFWNSPKIKSTRKKIKCQKCPVCFTPCQAQYDFLLSPKSWFPI